MKPSQYRQVNRNIVLESTKNDNSQRYGLKVIPNKKKIVKKFNFRKEIP